MLLQSILDVVTVDICTYFDLIGRWKFSGRHVPRRVLGLNFRFGFHEQVGKLLSFKLPSS